MAQFDVFIGDEMTPCRMAFEKWWAPNGTLSGEESYFQKDPDRPDEYANLMVRPQA